MSASDDLAGKFGPSNGTSAPPVKFGAEVMTHRITAWNIVRRVMYWCKQVFPDTPAAIHPVERALRFLEEAQELAQAVGVTEEQAAALTKYTWSRPVGRVEQEVGGVGVTFANLCGVLELDLVQLTEDELLRIQDPAIVAKIQKKQVTKQLAGIGGSPLGSGKEC